MASDVTTNSRSSDERTEIYLIGLPTGHSIASPIHNHIAAKLGRGHHFHNRDCGTVSDVAHLIREPSFAGAVVTMPYKKTIMPLLDSLDDLSRKIGSVNNVYFGQDGTLHGTNTDWNGIVRCLENASSSDTVPNKPALVIGAGGATRAAVYALSAHFGRKTIYVVNRDTQEVEELVRDLKEYPELERPNVIHVSSVEQAKSLDKPYYVIGTVPDFESRTAEEIEARDVLETFLAKNSSTKEDCTKLGVLLDLCYTPLETRIIKLGRKYGWTCVHGPGVVVHQRREQWKLWVGEDAAAVVDKEEEMAWKLLEQSLQRRNLKGVEGT